MDQKEAEAQKAAEELDKMIERVVAAQKEYRSRWTGSSTMPQPLP